MRAQFVRTMTDLMEQDERVCLLLCDILVHPCRELLARWPERALNVGISECGAVGLAAGLARAGRYPVVVSIAPFLAERALEFIKNDFGYQRLPGCFVTVGASYDYPGLGPTHGCPADVALMLTVPGMRICVPGHAGAVGRALHGALEGRHTTYIRLSEDQNDADPRDHAYLIGDDITDTTIIAVGPTWRLCPKPTIGGDFSVLYLGTVMPFPWLMLQTARPKRVLILEPFYAGTLTHLVTEALYPDPVVVRSIGVPRRFLRDYGTRADLDRECGLTAENVRIQLEMLRAA